MASAFSHALVAITLGKTYAKPKSLYKFLALGVFCVVIPDADVLAFKFAIPYDHFWGHRGFTHSLSFAFILSFAITSLFYRKTNLLGKTGLRYILFFFLCTASHPVLDAMTSGGLGVAFFAPFDNNRYFFPWRPIQVSPVYIHQFFGAWGLKVLKSEAIWVGIPCAIYAVVISLIKRMKPSDSIKSTNK